MLQGLVKAYGGTTIQKSKCTIQNPTVRTKNP